MGNGGNISIKYEPLKIFFYPQDDEEEENREEEEKKRGRLTGGEVGLYYEKRRLTGGEV